MVLGLRRKVLGGVYAAAALSVLAGCSDDPYAPPTFPFLASYKAAQNSAPVLLDNAEWWRQFNDPTLNALVEKGLSGNLSLDLAKERVVEARAVQRAVPQSAVLTPGAGVRRERLDDGPTRTRSEAGLNFDWILDIYGARRAQVEAAGARVEVAEAERDAARLLMLLNISNAYVDLRYHQNSLQLRQSELRSRRQTLSLIEGLFEGDAATRVDVVRARALVSETRAGLPEIEASIAAARNELAVLLGEVPGRATVALDGKARQPRVSLSPEVGIPADLLRNRPDIRVAERSYYAALRDVKSASADLYPRLSLSGMIGLTSLSGDRNTDYFFGPALRLPVLPDTSARANVELRDSRARQAHTSWRLTVLGAIRDVETSLVEYSASLAAMRASENTVRLYREVVDLTREIASGDGATIRDLIEAEQNVSIANTALAANLRRVGLNFIALNVSLGSGNRVGEARAELR